MARISDADKEAMKARLGEYLVRYCGVHDLNRNFTCPNPHHEDRNPSAQYNAGSNTVHCYGCGGTWDIFNLEGMREGIEGFADKAKSVADKLGYTPSLDENPVRTEPRREPAFAEPEEAGHRDVLEACCDAHDALYTAEGSVAREYLYARGFDDADMARYCLGFVRRARDLMPELKVYEPKALGFVTIPFLGMDGGTANYVMVRTIGEAKRKEWRPEGFKSPLWREWMLNSSQPEVFVCEGLLDAMALEKLTGRPTMALGGTNFANRLAKVLYHTPEARRPGLVVVCMDEDEPGRDTADTIARDLEIIGVRHQRLRPYPNGLKDANDLLMALKGKTWEFDERPIAQAPTGSPLPPTRATRWVVTNG